MWCGNDEKGKQQVVSRSPALRATASEATESAAKWSSRAETGQEKKGEQGQRNRMKSNECRGTVTDRMKAKDPAVKAIASPKGWGEQVSDAESGVTSSALLSSQIELTVLSMGCGRWMCRADVRKIESSTRTRFHRLGGASAFWTIWMQIVQSNSTDSLGFWI